MENFNMMTMTLSSNCVRSNMDAFKVALYSMNNKLFCVDIMHKLLCTNYMNYKRIFISC